MYNRSVALLEQCH